MRWLPGGRSPAVGGLAVLILLAAPLCAQAPAGLVAAASSDAWQRAAVAARRAGYDFADVRTDRVYIQAPGARLRKAEVPEGAVILRPRSLDRAADSLIDFAVDEKYGGDRALKLAIKAVNRLLGKQRESLGQLRSENKISAAQEVEIARRLLE